MTDEEARRLATGWGHFCRTVERVRRQREGERILQLHEDQDDDSDE